MNKLLNKVWKCLHYWKRRYYMLKYGNEALDRLFDISIRTKKIMWLDYGTLLGAVRDNDFIKHDDDIDLGMNVEDYDALFERSIFEAGFSIIRAFQLIDPLKRKRCITEIVLNYKGLQIDVFFRFIRENGMTVYGFGREGSNTKCNYWLVNRYVYNLNEFEIIKFRGVKFYIPKDYKSYLAATYGPNYMKPDKNWKGAYNEEKLEGVYGQMIGSWH